MKKKKVMASLVLSAMMIGTLGTSVSAASWKPDGTPGTSEVGGQGGTGGVGIVTRERHEKLFLVAVPTSARKYEFYADPTGSTINDGEKFQFQREDQTWTENFMVEGDAEAGYEKFKIDKGRKNFSNFVVAYNAGSKDVKLSVSANVSIADATGGPIDNDGLLNVEVLSTVLDAAKRADYKNYDNLDETDFKNWKIGQSEALKEQIAAEGGAIQQDSKTLWQIDLDGTPAADAKWLGTETVYSPGGIKYTKDYAVKLEDFNATTTPDKVQKEFKYPAALFVLKGEANKPESPVWDMDVVARLAVKWYITDPTASGPSIEQSIVITDIENGNKVPVSLGRGDGAMNDISSVKWVVGAEEDPNGVGFTQELLGSLVKYVPSSGSTGNLVFDESALRTLYNYESLNGATMVVEFSKPGVASKTVTFILWVY